MMIDNMAFFRRPPPNFLPEGYVPPKAIPEPPPEINDALAEVVHRRVSKGEHPADILKELQVEPVEFARFMEEGASETSKRFEVDAYHRFADFAVARGTRELDEIDDEATGARVAANKAKRDHWMVLATIFNSKRYIPKAPKDDSSEQDITLTFPAGTFGPLTLSPSAPTPAPSQPPCRK